MNRTSTLVIGLLTLVLCLPASAVPWTVFDNTGSQQTMTNAEPPIAEHGTEFGTVTAGVQVVSTFILLNDVADRAFTVSLTDTNGGATPHYNVSPTNFFCYSWGDSELITVVYTPLSEATHAARVRIVDNSSNTFDIMLHGTGTSPVFVVTNVLPRKGATAAAAGTDLVALFSGPANPATVTTNRFLAWGAQSGLHRGSITFNTPTNQATLNPATDFHVGEMVFAELTQGISNNFNRQSMPPFAWSFHVAATNSTIGVLGDSFQRLGTNDARGVALGDVNGDGWLDVVVANYTNGSTVWTNNRAGVLCDSGQRMETSRGTMDVALGDFNSDGDLDAILGTWVRYSQIWTNGGNGVFSYQNNLTTSNQLRRTAVADFDGDGDLDAVCAYDGMSNRLFRNDGAGSFSGSTTFGKDAARDATAGDFNGDGTMDVVVLSSSNCVVWTNNGALGFSVGATIATGGTSVAVGDLDGDTDLDIAIASSNGPATLWRNEAGTFSNVFANTIPGNAGVVQLGDLDGDGDLDLLRLRNDGGESSVWLNDGAGTFAEVTYQTLGVLPTPQRAELGDVDNDGNLDAVIALGTNGVRLFWNARPNLRVYGTNGVLLANNEAPSAVKGTDFGVLPAWSVTNTFVLTNAAPVNMEVSSITTSGVMCSQFQLLDTPPVINAWSSFTIRVLFEPTAIGTQSAVLVFSGSWTNSPFQIQLQGVYAPPLFVTNKTPANASNPVDRASTVTVQFSQPVDPATVTTNSFRLWGRTRGALAGTVSVDGSGMSATFTPAASLPAGDTIFADVADSVRTADGIYRLYPEVWSFIAEATNGTGIFYTRRVPVSSATDRPMDSALGDVDGDGDLDAMVSFYETENTQSMVQVFVNDGAGGFTNNHGVMLLHNDTNSVLTKHRQGRGVALGDLDGDGDLDGVVGFQSQFNNECTVLWNDGHGQFTVDFDVFPHTSYLSSSNGVAGGFPAVGDLDGDGDLDLFLYNPPTNTTGLASWLNDGAGHFSLGERVAAATYPSAARLGDLDGDGDLDAVVGQYSSPFVTYVMRNNGRGGFAPAQTITNANASFTCELGDVDGDGDLDIAVQSKPSALWLNDGTGHFTQASAFPSAEPFNSLGALGLGDLDADGDLDALLVATGSAAPYEMTNDGYGTFATGVIPCKGTSIYSYATGDLDGNGSLDAFCSGFQGRDHQVLLNLSPERQIPLTDLSIGMNLDISATCMWQAITFTMTLTNSGPDVATGIQVQNFPVPTNTLQYLDFNGGIYDTNSAIWSVANLAAGGVTSIQVSAFVMSTGWIQNVTQVYTQNEYDTDSTPKNYPCPEDDSSTNATLWAGAEANDFEVTMTVDNPNPQVGSNVIIMVGCTNKGPSDASLGPRILITLDPKLEWLSSEGNLLDFGGGVWSMGGGMLYRWLAITARVTTNGVFTNTAQIIFSWRYDPDSIPSNAPPYVEDDDDFVVLRTVPMIWASAGPYGSISPSGAISFAPGANASFVITADPYYWIGSLLTNGSPHADAAHARVYTSWWNDVRADGTVSVSFAEALAAMGTPEWWLAQYGLTNGGASFDEAETNDTDGDRFFAWQERIADTIPTNGNSFLKVLQLNRTNSYAVTFACTNSRVYSLESCWMLVTGSWMAVTGQTNITGDAGGTMTLVDTNEAVQRSYRIGVSIP